MTMWVLVLLMSSISMVMGSGPDKPSFCHGLDCPIFTVEKKTHDYELRNYKAAKWVSTVVEGHEYSKAQRTGFWRLFKYIGGDNEHGDTISMTAPVRTLVHPSEGPYCKSNFTISFFLPVEHQDAPPKPSNDEVFVEDNDEFEAYVASYGGWNTEDHFTQVAAKLFDKLADKGVHVRDDMYYTAGYDSPFRLTGRHNEVWLLAEHEKASVLISDG